MRLWLTFVENEFDIMSFTVATTLVDSAAYSPGPGLSVGSANFLSRIALNGATLQRRLGHQNQSTYFSRTSFGFFYGLYVPGPTVIGVCFTGSIVPLLMISVSIGFR